MTTANLNTLLRRANRLTRRTDVARAGLLATGALIIALLIVLAIDAVFGLTPWGLKALDIILLTVGVGGLGFIVSRALHHRFRSRRTAVMLEKQIGLPDSRLINAVEFSESDHPQVSHDLAEEAVTRGEVLAGSLRPVSGVGRAPLMRALRLGTVALLLLIVAYVMMPGVFRAVVPRLLAPAADHPPYTLINFNVQFDPERMVYGKPAAIHVALSGPIELPEQATVVFVDDPNEPRRMPMMPAFASSTQLASVSASDPGASYFVLRIERPTRSRTFYIDTPDGRSRRYTMAIHPVPLFEAVQVVYDYPEYTGWPSKTHPLGTDDLKALTGTQLTFRINSNVPLSSGRIRFTPDETPDDAPDGAGQTDFVIKPDPADPYAAIGRLPVDATGRFEMSLTGHDGTEGDETAGGRVVCLPDQPPVASFDAPDAVVYAVEGWSVDIAVDAQDDVRVERLELQHRVNKEPIEQAELEASIGKHGRADAQHKLDLSAVNARPGDIIRYTATAYDNRPPLPQSADTNMQLIQVISMDDYLELARQFTQLEDLIAEAAELRDRLEQLGREREALLDEMAELRQKLDSGAPLTDAEQQKLDELNASLEAFAEKARELAEDMQKRADEPALYEFEPAYQQRLAEMAAQLQQQADMAAALSAGGMPRDMAQQFAEMNEPFGGEQGEQQAMTVEDMERLLMADAMMQQTFRINEVIRLQRELAERMAPYRDKDRLDLADQVRANRLAEEQAALRDELADAQQQLRRMCDKAEDVLPKMCASGRRIADAIDELQIIDDQTDAEQKAFAGSGSEAYASAEAAAEKLESLQSSCKSMGGEALNDLDGCLSLPKQQMANAMQQLAQGWPRMGAKPGGAGMGPSGQSAMMASVMGPRSFKPGKSDLRSRTATDPRGKGAGTAGQEQPYARAETIEPDVHGEQRARTGVIYAVPTQYRALTDAYFERLAEENK